jgi:hypothetical protein
METMPMATTALGVTDNTPVKAQLYKQYKITPTIGAIP